MRDMHIEARRVTTRPQGDRKGSPFTTADCAAVAVQRRCSGGYQRAPLLYTGLARRLMAYLIISVTWWSPRFISLMSLSSCMPDFIRQQIYYGWKVNLSTFGKVMIGKFLSYHTLHLRSDAGYTHRMVGVTSILRVGKC